MLLPLLLLLLQASCKEQLDVIIEKLKMQHFCMFLQFYNVLTYKQLAGTYVDAWPFVPDAFSGECPLLCQ